MEERFCLIIDFYSLYTFSLLSYSGDLNLKYWKKNVLFFQNLDVCQKIFYCGFSISHSQCEQRAHQLGAVTKEPDRNTGGGRRRCSRYSWLGATFSPQLTSELLGNVGAGFLYIRQNIFLRPKLLKANNDQTNPIVVNQDGNPSFLSQPTRFHSKSKCSHA